jgi:hypothetical protein
LSPKLHKWRELEGLLRIEVEFEMLEDEEGMGRLIGLHGFVGKGIIAY